MKIKNIPLISWDGKKLIKVLPDGTVIDLSYGVSWKTIFDKIILIIERHGQAISINDIPHESTQSYIENTNEILTKITINNSVIEIRDFISNGDIIRHLYTDIEEPVYLIGKLNIDYVERELWALNMDNYSVLFSRDKKKYFKVDTSNKLEFPYPLSIESKGYYHQNNDFESILSKYKDIWWGNKESMSSMFRLKLNKSQTITFSENNIFNKCSPLKFKNRDAMILTFLTNVETWLTIAAPEWDRNYQISGWYEYVWFRDLYKVSKITNSKQVENSLVKIFEEHGDFPHRVWSNWNIAPGWCNGIYHEKNLIQYDQLAHMTLFFLKSGNKKVYEQLLLKIVESAYENGVCREWTNAWEDHYGQIFSSTTGVYLQVYIEAFKTTGNVLYKNLADSLVRDICIFYDNNHFIMWLYPNDGEKYPVFSIDNYKPNSKLDSATFELINGLIMYQYEFWYDEDLMSKIISHASFVLSEEWLYKETNDIFGIIRYKGDTWQRNEKEAWFEKIWSISTLDTAIHLGNIVRFVEEHCNVSYSDELVIYKNFIDKVKLFYRSIENIPEQFYDDWTFSSAVPLWWSHALRFELDN